MFAQDFMFDGRRASDFGLMIGSFDGGGEDVADVAEFTHNVIKTPNRDHFTWYSTQLDGVITWDFSVIKDTCNYDSEHMYFDQYEESAIAKWLLRRDGYHWLQFDQDGYEDIYYKVLIHMTPHQIDGKTIGFDLKITSDGLYGYSEELTVNKTFNSSTPAIIDVNSDSHFAYIYPQINFKMPDVEDTILIFNGDTDKSTFIDVANKNIMMDSDNDIIEGIKKPSNFDWNFLRLYDGRNIFTTNVSDDIEMTISYREPRRVIV